MPDSVRAGLYGAWRYAAPPDGDSDTSVTGWMVCALDAAKRAGLRVDEEAFAGALSWFDEVTDPETGRVGYDSPGSSSSRITGLNDQYPVESGEAMTAEALRSRLLIGGNGQERSAVRSAELMMRKLPEWDPDGAMNDMYYWYHGSYALRHLGDERYWRPWKHRDADRGPVVATRNRARAWIVGSEGSLGRLPRPGVFDRADVSLHKGRALVDTRAFEKPEAPQLSAA